VRIPPAVPAEALDIDPTPGGIRRHGVRAHGVRPARADPKPANRGHGQGQADHGPEAQRQRAMRAVQVGPSDGDLGQAADEQAESQGQKDDQDCPLAPAEDSVGPQRSEIPPRGPGRRQHQHEVQREPGRTGAEQRRAEVREADGDHDEHDAEGHPRSVEQHPQPGVTMVAAERRKRVRGHRGNRTQERTGRRECDGGEPLAAPDRAPGQWPGEQETQAAVGRVAGQHRRADHDRRRRPEEHCPRHSHRRYEPAAHAEGGQHHRKETRHEGPGEEQPPLAQLAGGHGQ